MGAGHSGKYEVLVSARTADEAIATAAEGLPRGAELIKSNAKPQGENTWHVNLAFRGGRRASSDLLE